MNAPIECENCKNKLESQIGFIFCAACGSPYFNGDLNSAFSVLGLSISFDLDETALENTYYSLSKRLHPDRFSTTTNIDLKKRSQQLSAALNQAYVALRQKESRLDALLKTTENLIPSKNEPKTIPADLAEEYFELQETLLEDPIKAQTQKEIFRKKLESKKQILTDEIFATARQVNWNSPESASSSLLISKVLDLRQKRSYIRSMLDNLSNSPE